jgi:glycine/D-amino acid oxidase-like deaminating enzyme
LAERHAVVIGAGITGVLTARQLLLEGWQVTVLEGAHVGAGSSSRTAAGIRQQFSTPGTVWGMRYCVDFYRRFQAEVETGEPVIQQNGYLFLHDDAERWAEAKEVVDMQRSVGLEVDVLEGAALRERFPWVGEALLGGTHCPTDGFLYPHLIYNEGARRVEELGGTLVKKAPVTGCTLAGDRIASVTTPKGAFAADLFVDATNAWTRRLGEALGAELLEVAPLKRYLWFLARGGPMSADVLAGMPLTIAPTGAYCRPENADTLLMGKKHDTPPDWSFAYDDQDAIEADYSHDGGIDAKPFELWMELAGVIPDLESFDGFSATTGGYYATTPDHNPFLGFDRQRPNLMRLVGFSGHGAMMAPFTARVAIALADAGHDLDTMDLEGTSVPLDAFRIGRAYAHAESMVI